MRQKLNIPWRKVLMNRTTRFVVGTCCSFALLSLAVLTHAQSPFDGTWRIDASKSKFDQKAFTIYMSQGWYHCVSCGPPYDVEADGQFHPVAGQPFDAESVTIVDPNTISFVDQKGGKTIWESSDSVSKDGKVLTIKFKSHPMNGSAPQEGSFALKRAGVLPPGVHATSGNWVALKLNDTEADLSFTFKSNGDELTMTDPTGDNYTAKLDGSDYPYKGSYQQNAVSLKRIDAHTVEETDKLNGKAVSVQKMTVSPNGKTMTIAAQNPQNGLTSTFVAIKK
jgi:hypothetical protein